MKPIPEGACLLKINDWISDVKQGWLIDYDGFGRYSDGKEMSDIVVYPSDLKKKKIDKSWSHVVWFNR